MLVDRLRTTDEALADSVFLDVTGRTAKRLLELAGEPTSSSCRSPRRSWPGMVGASRERVNKAISSFIRLGLARAADRHYRIVNRERLAQRSRWSGRGRVTSSRKVKRLCQASAASSARWDGRSGSCTKPCSASG